MLNEREWQELKRKEKILKETAKILRVEEKDVPRVTQRFLDELKEMEQKLSSKS